MGRGSGLDQSAPLATLPSADQVSGDPRGFDLTGDGERWEAAGGDEISEASEFPTVRGHCGEPLHAPAHHWPAPGPRFLPARTRLPAAACLQVLYEKWVDVLGQAAEHLEWEPAQVGWGWGGAAGGCRAAARAAPVPVYAGRQLAKA